MGDLVTLNIFSGHREAGSTISDAVYNVSGPSLYISELAVRNVTLFNTFPNISINGNNLRWTSFSESEVPRYSNFSVDISVGHYADGSALAAEIQAKMLTAMSTLTGVTLSVTYDILTNGMSFVFDNLHNYSQPISEFRVPAERTKFYYWLSNNDVSQSRRGELSFTPGLYQTQQILDEIKTTIQADIDAWPRVNTVNISYSPGSVIDLDITGPGDTKIMIMTEALNPLDGFVIVGEHNKAFSWVSSLPAIGTQSEIVPSGTYAVADLATLIAAKMTQRYVAQALTDVVTGSFTAGKFRFSKTGASLFSVVGPFTADALNHYLGFSSHTPASLTVEAQSSPFFLQNLGWDLGFRTQATSPYYFKGLFGDVPVLQTSVDLVRTSSLATTLNFTSVGPQLWTVIGVDLGGPLFCFLRSPQLALFGASRTVDNWRDMSFFSFPLRSAHLQLEHYSTEPNLTWLRFPGAIDISDLQISMFDEHGNMLNLSNDYMIQMVYRKGRPV